MSAADQLPDCRHQPDGLERLRDDPVGGGEPAARRLDASGQHHDSGRGLSRAELVEQVATVAGAEMHVEHDDIDVLTLELRSRLLERPGLEYPEPLQLEVHSAEQPK